MKAVSLQLQSMNFTSWSSLKAERKANSPQGRKEPSVYTNRVHLIYVTHAQYSCLTKAFSMSWQTPAMGSSSLLPSRLSIPCYPRAVQKQNIKYATKSCPLGSTTQGCSYDNQLRLTIPPSPVSFLMFTEVPDPILPTAVLFSRTDFTLAEGGIVSHQCWKGLCFSLPGKRGRYEMDFPCSNTWVMGSD